MSDYDPWKVGTLVLYVISTLIVLRVLAGIVGAVRDGLQR